MHRTPALTPSRRSLLLGAATLAPLVALGGASAHAVGDLKDAGGLHILKTTDLPEMRSVDVTVDTGGVVQTFNPNIRVTLPPSYATSGDRRYPMLLLLHGQGGDYTNWTEKGGVVEQTAKHDVIVVMPDGGSGSFYSNANFPLPGRKAGWESFIMTQVLPFIHANFRTDPQRMAIAGLSMGGWGALALGQRYWGHFRSVSSYSGPADCNPATPDGAAVRAAIYFSPVFEFAKRPTSNLPGSTWGPLPYPRIARGYNPMENLERYRGKRVFLRTGDGAWNDFLEDLEKNPDIAKQLEKKFGTLVADTIEAAVHPNMTRFHEALDAKGIANDFKLLPGRTHDFGLWSENLAEDLPGMLKVLNA